STLTGDFSSFSMNPPALSPSRNATTLALESQSDLIDSSILAPSIASALSKPARNRFITSALPSTRIIQGESNTPEPHASFSFPNAASLPAEPTSDTSLSISSPSVIVFVCEFPITLSALPAEDLLLAVRAQPIASILNAVL